MWNHILDSSANEYMKYGGIGGGFLCGVIVTFVIMLLLGMVVLLLVNYCRSKRIENAIERLEKTLEEHVDKDKKK